MPTGRTAAGHGFLSPRCMSVGWVTEPLWMWFGAPGRCPRCWASDFFIKRKGMKLCIFKNIDEHSNIVIFCFGIFSEDTCFPSSLHSLWCSKRWASLKISDPHTDGWNDDNVPQIYGVCDPFLEASGFLTQKLPCCWVWWASKIDLGPLDPMISRIHHNLHLCVFLDLRKAANGTHEVLLRREKMDVLEDALANLDFSGTFAKQGVGCWLGCAGWRNLIFVNLGNPGIRRKFIVP